MLRRMKKLISVAIAATFVATAIPAYDVQAASSTLIPDGWYYIKNVNSQKYVEVAGGVDANGVNVQQYEGNGLSCQKWSWLKLATTKFFPSVVMIPGSIELIASTGIMGTIWFMISYFCSIDGMGSLSR